MAVDADDLPLIVVDADHADIRIGRLGFEFSRETAGEALAPGLFGNAIDWIGAAGLAGAYQPVEGGAGFQACDIAPGTSDIGFEVGRDQPRLALDAIQHARQQRLFEAAIVQPADRGHCDCDQRNHCDS